MLFWEYYSYSYYDDDVDDDDDASYLEAIRGCAISNENDDLFRQHTTTYNKVYI